MSEHGDNAEGEGAKSPQPSPGALAGSASEVAVNAYRIEQLEAQLQELKGSTEALNFKQIKQMLVYIGIPVAVATGVFGVSLWQVIQTATTSAAERRASETVDQLTVDIEELQVRIENLGDQSARTVSEISELRGAAEELTRSVRSQADRAAQTATEALVTLDNLRATVASADDIQSALGDVDEIAGNLAENSEFQQQVSQNVLGGLEGMIVAFDQSSGCPPGWSQFQEAAGRMIIGVGQGSIDQIGDQDIPLTPRRWRDFGGSETHLLDVDEIPAHRHSLPQVSSDVVYSAGGDGANTVYFDYRERDLAISDAIQFSPEEWGVTSTGGSRPHNNMPPFVALYLCERI